jgi:hypothetical protein
MGWEDYHLHEFHIPVKGSKKFLKIGIPSEDDSTYGWIILPGYREKISDRFNMKSKRAIYLYDFGDDWTHQIELEGIFTCDDSVGYPICIDGKRACPPEDCGGIWGYEDIIRILKTGAKSEDDEEVLEWLGDHDPEKFDLSSVKFDDPKKRFEQAFN